MEISPTTPARSAAVAAIAVGAFSHGIAMIALGCSLWVITGVQRDSSTQSAAPAPVTTPRASPVGAG